MKIWLLTFGKSIRSHVWIYRSNVQVILRTVNGAFVDSHSTIQIQFFPWQYQKFFLKKRRSKEKLTISRDNFALLLKLTFTPDRWSWESMEFAKKSNFLIYKKKDFIDTFTRLRTIFIFINNCMDRNSRKECKRNARDLKIFDPAPIDAENEEQREEIIICAIVT